MRYQLAARCFIATLLGAIFLSLPAVADRIILTPSPIVLADGETNNELIQGLDSGSMNAELISLGTFYGEYEFANFYRPGLDKLSLIAKMALLPETSSFPSITIGLRDIGNGTASYPSPGYRGRAFYLLTGQYPVALASASYPLQNFYYSAGVGFSGMKGPFGSISADITRNLRWALEWDSFEFNEKLSCPAFPNTQLAYARLGKSNMISITYSKKIGSVPIF
jgi:hypothetical protein